MLHKIWMEFTHSQHIFNPCVLSHIVALILGGQDKGGHVTCSQEIP